MKKIEPKEMKYDLPVEMLRIRAKAARDRAAMHRKEAEGLVEKAQTKEATLLVSAQRADAEAEAFEEAANTLTVPVESPKA